MKLKTILFVWASITLFSGCQDVLFNNPLDPNASTEVLLIVKIVSTSLAGDGDIAYDGEKFWKVQVFGGLSAFDIETGTTIRSLGGVSGSGVALAQDRMFVCGGDNLLLSLDPLSGDIIDRISTVDLYPGYIAPLDDRLLLYDLRSFSFYDYDPRSGAAVPLFQVTGIDLGGLTIFQENILFTDKNSNSVYSYSMEGEMLNFYRSPASSTTGITVDNAQNIYLFTLDGQLYKVSIP